MFVNTTTAARIERAEAELTRGVVAAAMVSRSAPAAFVRALGDGVAAYVRPGSPMNKVIGAGLAEPIHESVLAGIEEMFRARTEPTRVELSTLARPESGLALTARGYRLVGFENVLVRVLSSPTVPSVVGVRVDRVTAATLSAWKRTTVDAGVSPDGTGAPVDQLSRDALVSAIDDFAESHDFDRYLAFLDGSFAGAASMRLFDGVALFSGAATLPALRRRGVHSALIAARIEDARARGAELAVITTAPGSMAQANVVQRGFALAYARAILVRA